MWKVYNNNDDDDNNDAQRRISIRKAHLRFQLRWTKKYWIVSLYTYRHTSQIHSFRRVHKILRSIVCIYFKLIIHCYASPSRSISLMEGHHYCYWRNVCTKIYDFALCLSFNIWWSLSAMTHVLGFSSSRPKPIWFEYSWLDGKQFNHRPLNFYQWILWNIGDDMVSTLSTWW